MKKVLSTLLVCFLVISMFSTSAFAAPVVDTGTQSVAMTGSDVSALMKSKIEETGVTVSSESIIELVPISSTQRENTNSALVVTNEDGNTVTKDVLLMVTDEGVGFEAGGDASTRAGTTVEFPPLSWDGRYVVRGTAVYNQYNNGFIPYYYQPIGAYFTYTKYQTCTVNSITIRYICDGFEYSYPGFSSLGYPELEYVIVVTKASPAESTMYSTTDPYNTSRVIFTGSGSPFIGQYLTFNTVANGEPNNYTVKL